MITGINESGALTNHISCEFKCKFDGRKCKLDQWQNTDKRRFECKKNHICENGKHLASIMDDSAIICGEYRKSHDKEIKTIPTHFH